MKHCADLMNQLDAGDLILADKGFLLHDVLPKGVTVNLPPFLWLPQFTDAEVAETRILARARVHIERLNAKVKKYRIMRLIPKTTFNRISMIVQTCVGLANFQNPLLKSMASDFYLSEEDGEFTDEFEL